MVVRGVPERGYRPSRPQACAFLVPMNMKFYRTLKRASEAMRSGGRTRVSVLQKLLCHQDALEVGKVVQVRIAAMVRTEQFQTMRLHKRHFH